MITSGQVQRVAFRGKLAQPFHDRGVIQQFRFEGVGILEGRFIIGAVQNLQGEGAIFLRYSAGDEDNHSQNKYEQTHVTKHSSSNKMVVSDALDFPRIWLGDVYAIAKSR